jgi:hypothetical protein
MDASLGVTQFTSAAIVVFAINKLKAATWFPLLQKDWTKLNRGFSIAAAFLVAQGIHWVWTPDTRVLAITIPTLSAFALGIWHWINQYAMQETLHQLTKPKVAVLPESGTANVKP